jgi:hypothetical protein
MHLKVLVKLKKTLKTLSSGQKNPKKPKKPKKNKKNPLGWVFKKKTRVFSNPDRYAYDFFYNSNVLFFTFLSLKTRRRSAPLFTVCTDSSSVIRIRTTGCKHGIWYQEPVFRIRIRIRIHMFLGHKDPDPDLLVRGMDPDPLVRGMDPDPSIIKQK